MAIMPTGKFVSLPAIPSFQLLQRHDSRRKLQLGKRRGLPFGWLRAPSIAEGRTQC